MPGIKMRENVQEREKMRENVWWYFPPTIIVKPLFSHFLHSYQLLLDEIVTLLSQALSILFIFFFLTFCVGRLGDDSELLITVVFGCCLAFGPKNWVQKKKYLIQETVCSVSKFLSVLILYFSCFYLSCLLVI